MGPQREFEFDVCVLGSANLDLVATVRRLPGAGETVSGDTYAEYPGGKGLNQAVAAARSGASVAFVGSVGHDAAADVVRSVLRDDGIDATRLTAVTDPTGRALIGVSESGENSIIVVAGANASVTGSSTPTARVVLSQLEVPLTAIVRAFADARSRGAITVLNPAPALELEEPLLQLCDVVIPNEHEVGVLGGVDRLLAAGVGTVIVTLGSRGADLHSKDGVIHVDAFPVTPVDTTAAGDSFCGSLSARLANGDSVRDAMRFAAAAGALCTTRPGAVPSIPRLAEIQDLLEEHSADPM